MWDGQPGMAPMYAAGPPPGAPPGGDQGQTPISTYMMGALIITALSGIMMIVDDFGGGYWRNEYTEGWFWLSAWDSIGGFLIIIPMALAMFYMAYWSSSAMRDPNLITISQLKRFFMISLGIGVFTLFLGIVFAAVMIIDDYNDWWFDVGFYGGLIGGFLAALIFLQAKKQAEAMGIRPS